MRDPEKSSGGKTCWKDCMAPIYGYAFPHKVNTKGCRHYEEHVLERVQTNSDFGLTATGDSEPGF